MLKHFSSERGLSLLSFPLVLASLIVVVLGSIQPAKAGGAGCTDPCSCYGGGLTYCHIFCGSGCNSCPASTLCSVNSQNGGQ